MAEMRKRTSMSVLEMGRMLGLGKTESYWLIKKNYFKTILVGNTMRVMIDSFEEWYANQFKYNPSLKLAIDIARVVEAPIEEIFVFK